MSGYDEAEATGKFARLEEQVASIMATQKAHDASDDKRFDKIDTKLDTLTTKVSVMAALGGMAAVVLQHLLNW